MTNQVVTAPPDATLTDVGGLMRDRNVGSVVIAEAGRPVAMITDRDVALAVVADGVRADEPAAAHASRPIVCGDLAMDL
jgi:CBS domain-containing protein